MSPAFQTQRWLSIPNSRFHEVACPVPLPENNGSPCLSHTAVRLGLQADNLAGVWPHHTQNEFDILEDGDIGEVIQAANQIADDTFPMELKGCNIPDRYTPGTSGSTSF